MHGGQVVSQPPFNPDEFKGRLQQIKGNCFPTLYYEINAVLYRTYSLY